MGNTLSQTFYMDERQMASIASTNPFLEQFFISIKNYQGYITNEIFYSKIINRTVEKKVSNKIFKLFSKKGCMSSLQLKHFYCALYSISNSDKISFIIYLIFGLKESIPVKKYNKKVSCFFSQSQFLTSTLTHNKLLDAIISDGDVLSDTLKGILSKHYSKYFDDFFFVKQYTTYENNSSSQFEYVCCCDNDSEIEKELKEKDYQPMYNQMYDKFEKLKNANGGFYPILLLNQYLLDVNVNELIVNHIIRYIQKTTMKNFIDYDTFYSIITELPSIGSEKSLEYLFNIMSYPNDKINKNTLIDIIKSINQDNINNLNCVNNTTDKTLFNINRTNDSLDIDKDDKGNKLLDQVTKEQFVSFGKESQFEGIYIIRNNIDRISLIPYLFFDIIPKDLITEYSCIQNIMGGKTIDRYSRDQLLFEDIFYVVPYLFWNNYMSYLTSFGELSKRPVLNIKDLCSNHNSYQLNTNAVYLRDYYLIPNKLYLFINKLCKKESKDIAIRKITYPKKEFSLLVGLIDFLIENNNMISELELVPISVVHFSLNYITLSLNNPNISQVKEFLRSMLSVKSKNINVYSRMTKLNQVKKDLMVIYNTTSWDTCELIIYYNEDFIKISNINLNDQTFDSLNIMEICVCLLNTKHEQNNLTYFDIILGSLYDGKTKETAFYDINSHDDISFGKSSKYSEGNNSKAPMEKNPINQLDAHKSRENGELASLINFNNYLGLQNMKNSCYINSVFQVIYNIPFIKKFLNSKTFAMYLTTKTDGDQLIICQLNKIYCSHQRYLKLNTQHQNNPFCIIPNSFASCIESISRFNREIQEDAGEFLCFVINKIHQEIKMRKKDKGNEFIETNYQFNNRLSEEDKINLTWGQEILNNASIINSLFLFLNQSTLTCSKCGKENITYQISNNLYLPIPNEEEITISVILHRLPFKYKVYYKQINDGLRKDGQNLIIKTLSSLKDIIIENNINIKDKEKLYLSPLATSIPLTISITLKQKDKLSTIISKLKAIEELELEPEPKLKDKNTLSDEDDNLIKSLTTFVVFHETFNVFLNVNKEISLNCHSGDTIHIYELLNTNGINLIKEPKIRLSLYKSSNIPQIKDKRIKVIGYNPSNNKILQDQPLASNDEDSSALTYNEYLIPVKHRYPKTCYVYLFHKVQLLSLGFMADYVLINNSKANISSLFLYDYIWEKYSYVLSSPIKNLIWWDNDTKTKKYCYPYILKLIDSNKGSCYSCPWFKFCKGCSIKPSNDLMQISPSATLVVEWCSSLIKSGEIFNNIRLTLSYNDLNKESIEAKQNSSTQGNNEIHTISSKEGIENGQNKKEIQKPQTIQQCLELCFQKETLDDTIMCSKCQTKTEHTKNEKIVKLPKYLMITLKRFKQMDYSSNIKNNSLIDFPINDLEISGKYYNLYGVIYHSGGVNIGHYYTILKGEEGQWVYLNDKRVSIIDNPSKIITNQAYILIYEENSNKNDTFLYNKLIDSILNNLEYNTFDGFVFDGEPVYYYKKFGIVKGSFFKDGNYHVKVLSNDESVDIK